MRLRAVVRLLRVALHLCRVVLTLALVYPRCEASHRLALKQQWSARILELLGISLECSGEISAAGLLISNHISFVDIFAINAIAPAAFVAKEEVRAWPLIGWLSTRVDTLFLERGSRAAAQRAREHIVDYLHAGKCVAVFPEGMTGRGDGVLPFHGAMFQAAIDAAASITPIAIAYRDDSGARNYAAAFVDNISLLACLWAIVCARPITVTVAVLPTYPAKDGDRRHLAAHAHRVISHRINQLH